jgi:poly(3-hydroxybutyrate) depolymerase
VIAKVRSRYGLTKILLAGNSNGGMMAERLVAEQPDITRRVAVWAAAPEMPKAGQWTGYLAAYDGSRDTTVPYAGGESFIGGQDVTIRPVSATVNWLIGATVHAVTVKGAGHGPVADWPAIAWRELNR